jgi:membrane associated rhomboid family serine protease
VVYVLQFFIGMNTQQHLFILGLVPRLAWSRFYIWQFVTYMFLHGNLFHLLINMYVLWMFGCEVERMWGPKQFIRYYFITGIGAGIIHTLITPFSLIPTIGASGAVMGVLAAFAVLFPNREITLLLFFIFPIRMKAKTLALLFIGISLLSGMQGSPDNVAHFAHLGGMLVGYLYMKRGLKLRKVTERFQEMNRRRKMRVVHKKQEEMDKLRRLLNQVLDKANEVGMENLTQDEKFFLKKASKILNRKKNKSAQE